MSKQKWFEELSAVLPAHTVKLDEPLSLHTITRMGGPADVFVSPDSQAQAIVVINYAAQYNIPLLLLGNGSNMVVRDGGVRGIVLQLTKLREVTITNTHVYAESGAAIIEVSKLAAKEGLTGLEFACGIPGTVGGAMVMNAGAYGGEIQDVIKQCTVVTPQGELLVLKKEDLDLGYRTSVISKKGYFVLSAEFELSYGEQVHIDEKIADLTHQRTSKQPLEFPSAGSVFKRPPGYFAGKLIQDSDLQGKGFGGAEVSTKHAGFIVNKDNATATDYIKTIQLVQSTVKEKFGVDLELEVKIVGEEVK
ncbi:UDP-N-acetylenolpyruvoylglucosamine reductase [Chryseomicrobium excrementi]|uniref:UDP-N-acetylenolpyruvoylglucosamine reductase n=1 Tax=Chryseomicrobium excrementi TaxID=2041346 RepID=A0A2M9EX67_9BACL|nr:UDP-N-acetylmuramate dehydrogenase [Chryseomicrobium excrementi]PJK15809.1 UDP-N-acetylenolpyruvoylglucosamine reductase [Chryseomicrobium excrementi]